MGRWTKLAQEKYDLGSECHPGNTADNESADILENDPIVTIVTIVTGSPEQIGEQAERAAIAQFGAHIPEEWCEGFAILQTMTRPDQFDPDEWDTLINDAGLFLDQWAPQATDLGWQTHEIFGLCINGNRRRLDCMGLIPLLKGRPVVALTDSFAEYRTATGAILRFYRHERAPVYEIKNVWK